MTKPPEYHFAECRLNAATRDLWWRGERQRIEPRVLDFLVYLIEQRDRVVRKDELIQHVWDGEILTDSVLARAASKARKAIGDVADDPALVRTVHSVGYRFIGEVKTVESAREAPSAGALAAIADQSTPPRPSVDLRPLDPTSAPSVVDLASAVHSPNAAPPAAPGALRYFALNEEVAAWTTALPTLRGTERLATLLKLAWHLRQRDTTRALALADEADALLRGQASDADALCVRARLTLVRGEAKWLSGQLHVAMDLAQQAAATFEACADLAGVCDAALLQAAIADDRDDPVTGDSSVRAALEKTKTLADDERQPLLQLQLALADARYDWATAETTWSPPLEHWLATCGPGVRAACHYAHANLAAGRGDRAARLQHALAARDLYAAVGQRRDVVRETGNVGACFTNLFDNEAALEWMTTALTEARATGWPLSLAACLAQAAATIGIMLKRPAEAVGLLDEARQLLAAFPSHRVALVALRYNGDIQQALGQHELALATFERAIAVARARRLVRPEADALMGRARALCSLQRPTEAREAALEGLALAEESHNDYYQYLVLETLASIHRDHPELPCEAVTEPSVVLHYLVRALSKQGTDNARTVPASLLAALATEYARLGDHANAYAYQVRSHAAYAEAQSAKISSRAIAMKICYDAERARADSEHHRALAAAHAQRAEALAQTNATLARIGAIGQEITRHLEARAIFETLERHLHGLIDASSLAVFVLDSGGTMLELAFGMASGMPLPATCVALNDPTTNVARCARECREIHVDLKGDAVTGIPGTLPSQSALFVPLSTGTCVLGVLTVQSPRGCAYGEREQLVLRSLSAYGAVALANAAAYHRLESARDVLALTHAELLDRDRELQRATRWIASASGERQA